MFAWDGGLEVREDGGPTERQQGGGGVRRSSSRAWAGGHRSFSTNNAVGGLTGWGGALVQQLTL